MRLALLALALASALAACAPKPGETCTIDRHVCADEKTMLACNTGVYASAACPGGCADPGNGHAICNFTGAKDGDVCAGTDHDRSACTDDGKARVICRDNRLTREACKGPNRCIDQGEHGSVACDRDYATVGDYCAPDVAASADDKTGYACEFQGKNQLICRGGAWALAQPCDKCEVVQHAARCTKTIP